MEKTISNNYSEFMEEIFEDKRRNDTKSFFRKLKIATNYNPSSPIVDMLKGPIKELNSEVILMNTDDISYEWHRWFEQMFQ